jgi:hypothetical protein
VAPAPSVLGPAVQQQHRRGGRVAGLQHVQVDGARVGGRHGDRAVAGSGDVGWLGRVDGLDPMAAAPRLTFADSTDRVYLGWRWVGTGFP